MDTPVMTCTGCGFQAPADFAFCPKCGRKLAAARADEADRRPVTVLFADLAGFTSLSERIDAEDVRAFQQDFFETLAAVIQQLDGFVEKFVGDAVLSVFGAPVAHEDDPERALRAALAMRESMRALSARWEPCFGAPLSLHVGVNTGPVVAGSLGGSAGAAYAVTGDTVNTAARLLGAAERDTILVSEATWRLTRHAFAFEPLGDLALRGRTEQVAVYRLLGVLERPRSARGLASLGLQAPLVGRAGELQAVLAAVDAARAGRAQIVRVVAEAGTGKSRLVAEALARLERDGGLAGVTVRSASCSSLGEPTYGVLASFFREAYRVASDDTLEVAREKLRVGLRALGATDDEVAGIAPLLGWVLGVEAADLVRHVEPEQLHRQIALATRILLERRLQQGPLLLVVEDLHWADAASIDLLRWVVDRLADRPLVLLVTHRPTLPPTALTTGEAAHTTVELAPLSADETAALLGAFFGPSVTALPERLRALVIARAGGNPFYVEEVVRSLIGDGVLVRDGEGWACREVAEKLDVPPTLHGLLLSGVDRLSPGARRLIQEAAVLGAAFDEALLRAVASEGEGVDVALDEIRRADLLEATSGESGRRRFRHALLQEAVYENVLVSRRAEMHGRAAVALERLCGGAPARLEDVEALGHHWSLSGDRARGVRYLVAAGDWARGVYANDDAVRHYERALRVLAENADAAETLTVRERLGDLLGLTGRRAAALGHYDAVRDAHAAAGSRAAEARLQRKIGGLHWEAGDRERALVCFEAGIALLDAEDECVERAHLYQEMGRLAFRGGDHERAIDLAERALAQVAALDGADVAGERRREAAAVGAHAYNTLGVALARTGRLADAVAHIERSVGVAESQDLLQAACRGYTNLGVLYATLDPARSIETCLKGLETARRIGDLGVQSRLYANLAVAYCALTDQCEAEGIEAARAAIDLDRRLGLLDHLAVPLIVLGQIHQCHGEPELALQYYREALGLAEQAGEPQLLFPCYDGLATLHLDLGDTGRAEHYMVKAKEVCERAGLEPDSLVVLPFLG